MYVALVPIKDEKCAALLGQSLLQDDVVECRERILSEQKEQGLIAPTIDAVLKLAKGGGGKCREQTLSRSDISGGWPQSVKRYLEWARELKDLDPETRKKVEEGLDSFAMQERKLFGD